MNIALLQKAAKALQEKPSMLMGSKWQNTEAEVIAYQTVMACDLNQREHGEALSWLGVNAVTGRQISGVNNSRGLNKLLSDGSLVREVYTGDLIAPEGTVTEGDRPVVLRVSDALLQYIATME